MKRDDFQPSVLGTLAQQWAITRALWADYWHCKREERRRARLQRLHTISLGQPGHEDVLFWVMVMVAVVCFAALIALQLAGVQ